MQEDLFKDQNSRETVSIKEAADKLNVSTHTIKNWVKAGYLVEYGSNHIDSESVKFVQKEIIGKVKLNSRANKLFKDDHNHTELSIKINELINHSNALNLSDYYESKLSNAYKNKEGIYYTPLWIVDDMFKGLNSNFEDKTFLDPCCGTGNFIIKAIEKGVKPENVYGFDTDENAIKIAEKRIEELTDKKPYFIENKDFLKTFLTEGTGKFDLILTNPPWGKRISKELKNSLENYLNISGGNDSITFFLLLSVGALKEEGEISFLMPESFFNISTFATARKRILEYDLKRIVDYGKAFQKLMTTAHALQFTKRSHSKKSEIVVCKNKYGQERRSIDSFLRNPKNIINFWVEEEAVKVIDHIFSLNYISLKNRAKWGLGIVTGNNKRFCSKVPKNGFVPVYKGSDIQPNGKVKNPKNFLYHDFSYFQQVAPIELYHSEAKVIYRFIANRLAFHCDKSQKYILNSANFFILNNDFPVTHTQISDLLNSEFINWLYSKLFKTHKVLRKDLEEIPIHYEYFLKNEKFDEKGFLDYLGIEKTVYGTYRTKKENN